VDQLELDSKFVGTPLKEYSCQINWREIMNYAAAIDDNNEFYFDDEQKDGIVAPPMFAVATTWPIIENLPEYLITDDFPLEVMMTTVHYSEHLKIYRLMKSGDEITIKGEIVAMMPHRAGTHVILCLEAVDNRNEPVYTQYHGGMLRGVECIGGGKGEENLPRIHIEKEVSPPLWEEIITIDSLRSYIYDGCSGITFPIHTSREFAHQVGLPGIIMQGTATLAYAVKGITNREAGKNPLKVKEIACRFTSIVKPGTEIRLVLNNRIKIENETEFFFTVYNEREKRAISDGYIQLKE